MTVAERNALIERELPRLRALVIGYLRRRRYPFEEWNDALQCAYLGVVRAADRWNPDLGAARNYLFIRAIGAILDDLRVNGPLKRRAYNGGVQLPVWLAQEPLDARTLEAWAERRETGRLVRAAVSRLSPIQAEAVCDWLRDIPQQETAARLGVTQGAVSQAYRRAKRRLREPLRALAPERNVSDLLKAA